MFFFIVSLLFLIPVSALLWLWPRYDYLPAKSLPFYVERILAKPIIHGGLSERLSEVAGGEEGYVNINGPSLTAVPDWLPNSLGKYYLYFSHHKGDHIRMACADHVEGPWTVHEAGALTLKDSGFRTTQVSEEVADDALKNLWDDYSICIVRDMLLLAYRSALTDQAIRKERGIAGAANSLGHIASPEVVVDNQIQRRLMYYHGLAGKTARYAREAQSSDGLSFTALPDIIHSSYLRVFRHRGAWYGLSMPGILYQSDTRVDGFEPRKKLLFDLHMRHVGLYLQGEVLYVFWSRVGDVPERILVSEVDLSPSDWDDWRATEPQELLRAELPWEGSELKVESSLRGELGLAANELRDPFVFQDED